jgi:hypothetical protein
MRAVRVHKFGGGPQDLVYEENVMQPRPKEGELLVKVYATHNILPSFMVILVDRYDNNEAHKEEIIDASKAPVLVSNNKPYIIKNLDTI